MSLLYWIFPLAATWIRNELAFGAERFASRDFQFRKPIIGQRFHCREDQETWASSYEYGGFQSSFAYSWEKSRQANSCFLETKWIAVLEGWKLKGVSNRFGLRFIPFLFISHHDIGFRFISFSRGIVMFVLFCFEWHTLRLG